MSSYQYERLSGQDNDFLLWEAPNLPMHVAGTQILDAGPLRTEEGGIDFDAIKRLTDQPIDRRTALPRWDGSPLDLHTAVGALVFRHDHPPVLSP